MEWLELNIDTSHAGLDAVTDMLERESGKAEKEIGEIGQMREAAAARDAGGEYL